MADRGGARVRRGLLVALAVLAFACGGLAVAWKLERDRGDCWRELAEEGLSAAGRCPP